MTDEPRVSPELKPILDLLDHIGDTMSRLTDELEDMAARLNKLEQERTCQG